MLFEPKSLSAGSQTALSDASAVEKYRQMHSPDALVRCPEGLQRAAQMLPDLQPRQSLAKWILLVFFVLCLVTLSATAAPRPAVIELYTSEGCSSCPPAEQLIEQLARESDVLPLAFHVDYWDSLGWRDRFSMQEATARQQDTARLLGLKTVGTPQLVVDGKTAIWGASRSALERALKAPRSNLRLDILRRGPDLIIHAERPAPREAYIVYAIGYLPKAVTRISRGENAGRTLMEANIVRYIHKIGASSDASQEWRLPLQDLPKEAERIAIILQQSATGAVVGAQTVARNEMDSAR